MKKVNYQQTDLGSSTEWNNDPPGGPVDHSLVPANEPISLESLEPKPIWELNRQLE